MSALTANRTNQGGKLEGKTAALIIKNGVTIYTGAMVAVDNSGALPIAAGTASLRFMGVAVRGGTGDGSTIECVVQRRGTVYMNKASASASDLGQLAWASDDQTVVTSAPGNAYVVGQVVAIIDSGTVEIDLEIKSL